MAGVRLRFGIGAKSASPAGDSQAAETLLSIAGVANRTKIPQEMALSDLVL